MAQDADQGGRQSAHERPRRPLLLAVDDDIEALRRLTRELAQRYDTSTAYRACLFLTPACALLTLRLAAAPVCR
jgi:hypothetical protein